MAVTFRTPTESMSLSLVVGAIALSSGAIGLFIAYSRGRSRLVGFALGLLGLAGWLIAAYLPPASENVRNRRETVPMPIGMKLGAVACVAFAGVWSVLLPLAVANVEGLFAIGEQRVSGHEFLVIAYPFVILLAGIALAIAWGFRSQRAWARPLSVAIWMLLGLSPAGPYLMVGTPVPNGALAASVLNAAVLSLVAWWYFYRKPNVVLYFVGSHELERQAGPA